MTNPFKRWHPELEQIHQYTIDIQRVMALREKAVDDREREGFDTSVHVMQEILIFLNTMPKKNRQKQYKHSDGGLKSLFGGDETHVG